jgi:hypothetical protein
MNAGAHRTRWGASMHPLGGAEPSGRGHRRAGGAWRGRGCAAFCGSGGSREALALGAVVGAAQAAKPSCASPRICGSGASGEAFLRIPHPLLWERRKPRSRPAHPPAVVGAAQAAKPSCESPTRSCGSGFSREAFLHIPQVLAETPSPPPRRRPRESGDPPRGSDADPPRRFRPPGIRKRLKHDGLAVAPIDSICRRRRGVGPRLRGDDEPLNRRVRRKASRLALFPQKAG